MYDVFVEKRLIPFGEMAHEIQGFGLTQPLVFAILLEITFKVSILAEFQYHVDMLSRTEIVIKLDNKGRAQSCQILYLVLNLLLYSCVYLLDVDTLNCNFHPIFILPIEDRSRCARSKGVRFENSVISNLFNNLIHHYLRYAIIILLQQNRGYPSEIIDQGQNSVIFFCSLSNRRQQLIILINMELTNSIVDFLKRDELFWPLLICSGLAIYLVYYCIFRNPHYLIKCKYNTKKKNIGRPPPPFPNGWYNICFSHELPVKNVKSADIAGQNIVLYRGEDNLPYALDAYCLHMGAHMGEGGQVINKNCIQCPFHGWLYDGSTGQCVDHDGKALVLKSVEYNRQICEKNGKLEWIQGQANNSRLRKYPVCQINGYIYIWLHQAEQYRQKPLFPVIDVTKFIKKLQYRSRTQHHINCHIQDIPQNGADVLHFKYVHSYIIPALKVVFFKWNSKWMQGNDPDLPSLFQHPRSSVREFKQRVLKEIIEPFPAKQFLSIANLENDLHVPILGRFFMLSATIIQCGLSVVFVIVKSPLYQLIFHHYIQPQQAAKQHVFHDCFISSYIPYCFSALASFMQGQQVTNDMFVWSAKKFGSRAHLVQGRQSDQYIRGWRKWSSQFYDGCQAQLTRQGLSW